MKRWIIGIGLIGLLLAAGIYWLSQQKLEFGVLVGKTAEAKRKKLSIPIRASGQIEPASQPPEIKSKASGAVQRIHVKAGDMVRKGDLLLELDPQDEQRAVDRLSAEFDRAKANYQRANVSLEQMKKDLPQDIKMAQAEVDAAQAGLAQMRRLLDKEEHLRQSGPGATTADAFRLARENFDQAAAQVAKMEAGLDKLRNNQQDQIKAMEQNVALAEADYKAAEKNLEDGRQRLIETKIYAPIDGMVTKIPVHVGEMIQSGTQSLTGGTLLMTVADVSDLYVTAQVDEADISTVLDLAPARARPGLQRTEAMARAASASAARSDTPQGDPPGSAASRPAESTLSLGKPVQITVEAFREETFQGVIEHIAPEPLRQQSVVTYDVRIKLSSENRYKLLLGMQADAEFTLETVDAVVIPVDAVRILDGDDSRGNKGERGVWMPGTGTTGPTPQPQWRTCRFGLDDGSEIEVISGLKEGEKVYTILPAQFDKNKDKNRDTSEG